MHIHIFCAFLLLLLCFVVVVALFVQKRTMYSQADLEERVQRDVDQARQRCQESASREFQRKEADKNKKNAASGRWAGVAADRSRLLRGTKVRRGGCWGRISQFIFPYSFTSVLVLDEFSYDSMC